MNLLLNTVSLFNARIIRLVGVKWLDLTPGHSPAL